MSDKYGDSNSRRATFIILAGLLSWPAWFGIMHGTFSQMQASSIPVEMIYVSVWAATVAALVFGYVATDMNWRIHHA